MDNSRSSPLPSVKSEGPPEDLSIPLPESDTAQPSTQPEERTVSSRKAAYLTLFGAWLTAFTTFGYLNSFGVFQDLYTRSGAGSASQISWIGTVQFFLILGVAPISGRLLDKGYFRPTMICGATLYSLSSVSFLLAST
jgi:MFS family permease